MTTHVMLDLETLASKALNAAIVSIGAVKFDPDAAFDPVTCEKFYQIIDLEDAMKYGRVEADTLKWWFKQSLEARAIFDQEFAVTLDEALLGFNEWYGPDNSLPIWGNGATFDNVVLTSAYAATGIDRPWNYRADRCFRTIKNILPPVDAPDYGVKHNALDDAMAQTLWLLKIADYRHIVL